MKTYIAGPISIAPSIEVAYENFNRAEELLKKHGYEPFNPMWHEASMRAQKKEITGQEAYRQCLLIDLSWICEHAEAIYMLKGWEKSPGGLAEHATAVALGLKIMYEAGEL